MVRNLPIYKITFTDEESIEIALVEDPAIEIDFLKFNAEAVKLEFNEDKKIVKGAVMIPNQLIYRNDKIGERFVTYDSFEIEKAATLFLKNGMKFNRSHSEIQASLDIYESYIATEVNDLNVPAGSWIISAKVKDDSLWKEIKENLFNGFSVQAIFSNELIGAQEIKFNKQNEEMDFKEKLQAVIDAVFFANEKPAVTVEKFEEVIPEVKEDEPKPESVSMEQVEEIILSAVTALTEKFNAQIETLGGKLSESEAKLEEFSKQPISATVQEVIAEVSVKNDNPALRIFAAK